MVMWKTQEVCMKKRKFLPRPIRVLLDSIYLLYKRYREFQAQHPEEAQLYKNAEFM
jgi:hypothetical protein